MGDCRGQPGAVKDRRELWGTGWVMSDDALMIRSERKMKIWAST